MSLLKFQGEFPFPCVDKWTDQQLGIPPDSEDDPEQEQQINYVQKIAASFFKIAILGQKS